jgi:hypothetical protein
MDLASLTPPHYNSRNDIITSITMEISDLTDSTIVTLILPLLRDEEEHKLT